jgi:hypothetical protein
MLVVGYGHRAMGVCGIHIQYAQGARSVLGVRIVGSYFYLLWSRPPAA